MTFFDLMGLTQRIPFDVIQRLEGEIPKFQQLLDLEKQAEPHVNALSALVKQGEAIWASLSPDVKALLDAIKVQQ